MSNNIDQINNSFGKIIIFKIFQIKKSKIKVLCKISRKEKNLLQIKFKMNKNIRVNVIIFTNIIISLNYALKFNQESLNYLL